MLDGDNSKTLVSQGVGGRQHGCWTDDLFLLAGLPSRASGSSQVLPIVPGGLGLTPGRPEAIPVLRIRRLRSPARKSKVAMQATGGPGC